jgi:magnesium chelatase family protein
VVLPTANTSEAAAILPDGIVPVSSLSDAVAAINSGTSVRALTIAALAPPAQHADFADVTGQPLARRAIEIAAAGGHNLLLVGPPGAGKTMMARRMAGVLPPLTFDESIEATTVHSVAGRCRPDADIADQPFVHRATHLGGGRSGRRFPAAARRGEPRAPWGPLP